jgi:hypothetical protein
MLGETFTGGATEATALLNKLLLVIQANVIWGKRRNARGEREG